MSLSLFSWTLTSTFGAFDAIWNEISVSLSFQKFLRKKSLSTVRWWTIGIRGVSRAMVRRTWILVYETLKWTDSIRSTNMYKNLILIRTFNYWHVIDIVTNGWRIIFMSFRLFDSPTHCQEWGKINSTIPVCTVSLVVRDLIKFCIKNIFDFIFRSGSGAPIRNESGRQMVSLHEDPDVMFSDSTRNFVDKDLRYRTTPSEQNIYRQELDRMVEDKKRRKFNERYGMTSGYGNVRKFN